MTTLSMNTRKTVRDSIIEHAFYPQHMALSQRRRDLAYKVYEAHIKNPVAQELQEPWVTRNCTHFAITHRNTGGTYGFCVTGGFVTASSGARRNFVHRHTTPWATDSVGKGPNICLPGGARAIFGINNVGMFIDQYNTLADDDEKLWTEAIKRRAEIDAVLKTHKTVKSLLRGVII